MLDEEWQHADNHAEGYIDIFRMTGFEQHRVQLRLGLLARNLLIEEYPLAERDITQLEDGRWLLDTKVCNFVGIGRFVMGLAEDIEVLTPEFDAYIKATLERIYSRYK